MGRTWAAAYGVKDLIENGPTVDRVPVRILGVDVRRAPFEIRLSVPGSEQEMGADIDRDRAQIVAVGRAVPGRLLWSYSLTHRSQTSYRWV